MPFPVTVQTVTVTGLYLDPSGKPAKGMVAFKPDLSALGEGVAVAPISVRRTLDANGAFSISLPVSVNTGLNPDFTYEYTLSIGGTYTRRIYQLPASADPIDIETLVPTTVLPARSRFVFPTWTTAPTNPRPGEVYYDPTTGDSMYWNAVLLEWVPIVQGTGGGGGAPSGPAGGSLAGTYPNPTLKANSVGTSQLADLSVTAAKLSVSYVPTLTYNADLATTATALGTKSDVGHTHTIANVTGLQTAIDAKAPLASPTFTGTVSGITKSMVGLGNVDNTSDANKPLSTAATNALALKADLVGGVIPTAQIPAISIVEFLGNSASQAAMLALSGQKGDWTIRTDLGQVFVITGSDPTQLASWTAYAYPTAPVTSVNSQTGVVVLSKTDVGLSNVDNTSDANKPVSSATQTALNLKAPLASPTFTGTVSGITKAMVGLGNVDNTADTSKPISTLQQAALDLKAPLASPTFTGTVSGITKAMVGLANVDNTSDANKPVSTAQQTALNLKANISSLATVATTGAYSDLTGKPTLATVATTGDYNDLINKPAGGGGGTAATFARAQVTSGDVIPGATASWTPMSGLTLAIAAAIGDKLTLCLSCLLNQTSSDFFEMVVVVGGSIVRYSSTGTSSTTTTNEGDPSIYPISGAAIRSTTAQWNFTAASGDISGGNVTFALAFRGSGSGKAFATAGYPFRWFARNDH